MADTVRNAEKHIKKRGAHLAKYQFKPGQIANPKGRPRGTIEFPARLIKALNYKGEVDGKKNIDSIIDTLIKEAKGGNIKAAELIFDRAFGKAVSNAIVSVNDDRPNMTTEEARARLTSIFTRMEPPTIDAEVVTDDTANT